MCAEGTVTVVQVQEIRTICGGISGINDDNHPFRIIFVEALSPMVRLAPEPIIGDFRAEPRDAAPREGKGDSSDTSWHKRPGRLVWQ
jgi:hypothetical protein